jgi:hypothetical protein
MADQSADRSPPSNPLETGRSGPQPPGDAHVRKSSYLGQDGIEVVGSDEGAREGSQCGREAAEEDRVHGAGRPQEFWT